MIVKLSNHIISSSPNLPKCDRAGASSDRLILDKDLVMLVRQYLEKYLENQG